MRVTKVELELKLKQLAAENYALKGRISALELQCAARPTVDPRYPHIDHRGRACRIEGNVRCYPATH